jgi:hypothetical protein
MDVAARVKDDGDFRERLKSPDEEQIDENVGKILDQA